MILVDTSVWIEHFRAGSERLKTLLLDEQVLCHPFIIGELACGNLRKRSEILTMLQGLPKAQPVEHEEVLGFVEARRFYGVVLVGWTLICWLRPCLPSAAFGLSTGRSGGQQLP